MSTFTTRVAWEWRSGIRQRFLLIYSVAAILGFMLSFLFGGTNGSSDFRSLIAAVQVGVLLLPFLAIHLSAIDCNSTLRKDELLLALPVSRSKLYLAKFLAQVLLFGAGLLVSLIALSPLLFRLRGAAILDVLALFGLFWLLGSFFIGAGNLIGILARGRIGALIAASAVWLSFSILGDTIAILLSNWLSGISYRIALFTHLAINPVALIRTTGMLLLGGTESYGAAGLLWLRVFSTLPGAVLFAVITTLLGIAVVVGIGVWRFQRTEVGS
ncbi:MAG: ABC transporter permease [bacterium]|nr:ABC transporter permease [bacterium]